MCLAPVTAATVAELPRAYVDTTYPTQTGASTQVNAGADLQAAIAAARPGDTLLLQTGAVFAGNFTLPAKSGDGWVVIRSAAPDTALPPPGVRLSPDYAAQLPKLVSPNTAPALAADPAARRYRLVGLEITVDAAAPFSYGLVSLGSGEETGVDQLPSDIVVDRSYVHGQTGLDVKRGVQLNSVRSAVIDSAITEIHSTGQDSQAIEGWNGPGPFKIVNNELQAAGENVMFGGADTGIADLVPADIEIRCNHLDKPLAWKPDDPAYAGTHWSVKNLLELKSARRVLIDGNVMERNWADAQAGWAVLLTVRTGSQTWAAVEDVTLTHNIVRHTAKGFEATGVDDNGLGVGRRVVIQNNLFDDVNGVHWGGGDAGWAAGLFNGTAQYVIDHNTLPSTWQPVRQFWDRSRLRIGSDSRRAPPQTGQRGYRGRTNC